MGLARQLLPPKWMGRECYPTAGDWFSNVGVQGQEGDKLLAESGDVPSRQLWSAKAKV
jgi:hypothetical protein